MTAALPAVLDYPHATPPCAGEALSIAPGVLWLRMPLPFALNHINTWAIADERDGRAGWTLVDCGLGNALTRAHWETLFAGALRRLPVLRVLVTHYHPDHVGSAAWLCERFGCALDMTIAEFLSAWTVKDARPGHSPEAVCRLFARHGLPEPVIAEVAGRGNTYAEGVPALPETYQRIYGGDVLSIGGRAWRVIIGRGHSPEHVSLHCAELGVLIAGDMLLPRISTNVSVWPADPDGDPLARFLASISRYEVLPPETLVLPSHGLPFAGISLRVEQLRAHHEARLDELMTAAAQPITAYDAVGLMFRRELDAQQIFFAMGEAIAHLNLLWHEGRLRRFASARGHWQFVR
ncbi:MAG: MBL fold metallo-hydrolase [Hyphomicrobiales bacterium]|nr:MBL fold metallo-hydrolase [Hyphomicrobiales bacterium]